MVVGMRKPFHYGWVVLAMGTLTVFGALGLGRFGYSTILPLMQVDLNMGNEQAGLLATISLAGYLGWSIIGGALAVRYGIRIIASCGLLVTGMGMIFAGSSHGFVYLAASCFLAGIGSGAANIAVMGLWSAWFSVKRRGFAAGIAVTGSSLGLIFTGIFVPWRLSIYGTSSWRISWIIFGSIALVLAVASYIILRNSPAQMGLRPIGEEDHGKVDTDKPSGHLLSKVYTSPLVWRLGLVYFAFGFSYIIYLTFFLRYLTIDLAYSSLAAGRYFMLIGWFSLGCGLIWGALSDYIGRRKTIAIIFLFHAISYCLFALGKSSFYIATSAILFGLSAWSIPALMAAVSGDLFNPRQAPAAFGFITFFFGIGQALGPSIAGVLTRAFGSFPPVFLMIAIVSLLGAAASMWFERLEKDTSTSG